MITFTIKIFGTDDPKSLVIESKYLLGIRRIKEINITPMECEEYITITKNICDSEATAEVCEVIGKYEIFNGKKRYVTYMILLDDNEFMVALDEEYIDDMYWLKYCYLVG